jgi:hypothetical protein
MKGKRDQVSGRWLMKVNTGKASKIIGEDILSRRVKQ